MNIVVVCHVWIGEHNPPKNIFITDWREEFCKEFNVNDGLFLPLWEQEHRTVCEEGCWRWTCWHRLESGWCKDSLCTDPLLDRSRTPSRFWRSLPPPLQISTLGTEGPRQGTCIHWAVKIESNNNIFEMNNDLGIHRQILNNLIYFSSILIKWIWQYNSNIWHTGNWKPEVCWQMTNTNDKNLYCIFLRTAWRPE